MKYLVLSDIHGASEELSLALNFYEKYQCDFIVLLGDLLNHGPRNTIPISYAPQSVSSILNKYSEKIISVRGNCDSEVDSMMFNFPCNAPYGYLLQDKQRFFLTHGHLHKFDTDVDLLKLGLKAGDIVLSGHTHVQGIFKYDNGIVNINVGSISIPKGGTQKGFGIIFEDRVDIFTLSGEVTGSFNFVR